MRGEQHVIFNNDAFEGINLEALCYSNAVTNLYFTHTRGVKILNHSKITSSPDMTMVSDTDMLWVAIIERRLNNGSYPDGERFW